MKRIGRPGRRAVNASASARAAALRHHDIGHDDIHAAGEEVVALDVADEVEAELGAEAGGLAGQLGALGFLGPVAEDADAGIGAAQDGLGVDLAHEGELHEVQGLALGVRAGVEQKLDGLEVVLARRVDERRDHEQPEVFARAEAHINSLNPQRMLERGYSITQTADGGIVRDSALLQSGQALRLTFARGSAEAEVKSAIAPEK